MVTEQVEVQESSGADENIRRLQSKYDSRLADIERRYTEERSLNDDLSRELADYREKVDALTAQGYSNLDPEVAAAKQEVERLKREVKDSKRLLADFGPRVKSALIKAAVLEHGGSDAAMQERIRSYLGVAKTAGELDQRIQAVQESLATVRTPAPGRDEVDAGRGTGRSSGVRYTRALLQEHMHDNAWRAEHMGKVEAFVKQNGGILPER